MNSNQTTVNMTTSPTTYNLLQEYGLVSFVACLVIMLIARVSVCPCHWSCQQNNPLISDPFSSSGCMQHNHPGTNKKQQHAPLLFLPLFVVKWFWPGLHHIDHDDVGGHHHQGHFHHTRPSLQRKDAFGASTFNSREDTPAQ